MSRLRSRGSLGELGPGDLEMLLLRLRMREGRVRAGHTAPGGSGAPGHSSGCNLDGISGGRGFLLRQMWYLGAADNINHSKNALKAGNQETRSKSQWGSVCPACEPPWIPSCTEKGREAAGVDPVYEDFIYRMIRVYQLMVLQT